MSLEIAAYFVWGYKLEDLPKEKLVEVLQLPPEVVSDLEEIGVNYIFPDIQDAMFQHFPGLKAINPKTPKGTKSPGIIIGKVVESTMFYEFPLEFRELKALVYKLGIEPTAFLGLDIT